MELRTGAKVKHGVRIGRIVTYGLAGRGDAYKAELVGRTFVRVEFEDGYFSEYFDTNDPEIRHLNDLQVIG